MKEETQKELDEDVQRGLEVQRAAEAVKSLPDKALDETHQWASGHLIFVGSIVTGLMIVLLWMMRC